MKIGIASDHRGFALKKSLIEYLEKRYEVIDYGTNSDVSVDYPDYAFRLGKAVSQQEVLFGIAICGSGIGISIACNKVKGIRAAKVNTLEEVILTRQDNDANILCLSSKTAFDQATKLVDTFLETPFSKLERHQKRIEKIQNYEEGNYVC